MGLIAHIGAAHLDVFLDPRFGEDRRHMVGPVRKGGLFARQCRKLSLQEIAEALPKRIDVVSVAVDEVHRHIQHPVHIALKAHPVFKGQGQHAGARVIQPPPDARTPAAMAIGLALEERRRGEERGRHGLQRQRNTQLLHHVGLGGKVEVHLHGRGAIHHLRAMGADAPHVIRHKPIAPLGHDRHILMPPFRRGADPHEAHAPTFGDGAHLIEVVLQLGRHLMRRGQRRA